MDRTRTSHQLATAQSSLSLPTWDEIRTKQEEHDKHVLPSLINKNKLQATKGHLLDNASFLILSDDRKQGLEHLKPILEETGVKELFWVVFRATRRNRTYGEVVREMVAERKLVEEDEEKEGEVDEVEGGAGVKRKR